MNTNSISVQLGTETSLSARMETETSLSAGLETEASFSGQLGTGAAVVNDYRIQAEEIEDGHRLIITRGSEVQTFDLQNGAKGIDGKTSYLHIKYSAVMNPATSEKMLDTPSTYIGTYVDFTQEASTDPSDYTWARFQGNQGPKGTTFFVYIRYSDDGGKTFTANSGSTSGAYLGVYVNTHTADIAKPGSYRWAKIKGDKGDPGKDALRPKFAEKVMLYYGYPNAINNSWDVNNSANIYKDYDVCIFGDGYCLPTHEAHAETAEIFRILKRIAPDTRIVGYVPIGVQNVGSDSNLSMDELKRRVDLWQSIGADGIFLDEYGYDYGVTRARQNEIVNYCHDRGMFVFANSWSIEYCFSDEDIVIDWMEDFHPNPDGLRAVLNAQDYYVYEHLFYNSYHDGDGNLHVECAEPYRIDNILQYFNDVRIDGKSYREIFGTKVFSLDAIPTGASLREKNEMMSLSIIGAAILNIDAIAFGDDMWSSSGNYHQWDFPQLNLETDGLNSISRSTRTYTDAEGNTAEFTYRWAASINGNQYAIVFDVETPTDVDYVVGKRYAECNGVRVDNAWLTIYDFQEFMDSTAAQVETNTTLVNETVQKVENALPNALQAEEKVNAFMTASDARIEDMESRVNSAISDIEVLTKGFNYLEVEW